MRAHDRQGIHGDLQDAGRHGGLRLSTVGWVALILGIVVDTNGYFSTACV
jgi:hypothetical protein